MGVLPAPIVAPKQIALGDRRAKTVAVDGEGDFYQFLALICRSTARRH
jgi:hypothetical protein